MNGKICKKKKKKCCVDYDMKQIKVVQCFLVEQDIACHKHYFAPFTAENFRFKKMWIYFNYSECIFGLYLYTAFNSSFLFFLLCESVDMSDAFTKGNVDMTHQRTNDNKKKRKRKNKNKNKSNKIKKKLKILTDFYKSTCQILESGNNTKV